MMFAYLRHKECAGVDHIQEVPEPTQKRALRRQEKKNKSQFTAEMRPLIF